jgi:hypothetical protein
MGIFRIMTRPRSTSDVYPTRASSSYLYLYPSQPAATAPQQPRRAQTYPWWIWAVGPALTIGLVFAMLQVQ